MVKIYYPTGPSPPVRPSVEGIPPRITLEGETFDLEMIQGQGINAAPFESEKIMDLTFPMGKGSGIVYGLCFQFGKWGYDSAKIDHAIEVSPVFTEYYSKTMGEKSKLEAEIKTGFASVVQAVSDFELIDHDLRKYKEHLDRFKELEEAKKSKDKERIVKAQHVLKATFVDEVDAHTGEGISLRSIAPRWPTIIADFMSVLDEDDTPEKIMDRIKEITKPEAVILKTKNDLYKQWKELFFSTLTARYQRLKMLAASRKASIKEYRENLRPLISRLKAMPEMRERTTGLGRGFLGRTAWVRPDSQAVSLDTTTIWAWRPFVVEEVFKASREEYEEISLQAAGFNEKEIKELRKNGISSVRALPAKPIVDKFVRAIIKQIEQPPPKGYGVEITPVDVVEEINNISSKFRHPERPSGLAMGPRWQFSPYYIFIQISILRGVFKLPDGSLMEDLWIQPFKAWNVTQNIMLGRLLELRAKLKADEKEISVLVGDIDMDSFKKIDDIIKEEYPEFYEGGEKKKRESPIKKISENIAKINQSFSKIRAGIASFLGNLGINLLFVYPGPYEKFMHERMTKMMQRGPGIAFLTVDQWLKRAAGVMAIHEVEV